MNEFEKLKQEELEAARLAFEHWLMANVSQQAAEAFSNIFLAQVTQQLYVSAAPEEIPERGKDLIQWLRHKLQVITTWANVGSNEAEP